MIKLYSPLQPISRLLKRIPFNQWCVILSIIVLTGCKEAYVPAIPDHNNNILVVEGTINTGADSTIIKLSRMVGLSGKKTINPEIGAVVSVESESNERYVLLERQKGTYAAPPLNLNAGKKYRLSIKTLKGASYLSEFVQSKSAPPIDSLTWDLKDNGVHFYVNTHDEQNNTTYYRWEYTETWVFFANNFSMFKFNGETVVPRDMEKDNVFQCWGTEQSNSIFLGSSAKLSKDVISQQPIAFVPSFSEKFSEKYSVEIRQYALTKEAYEFWENLKKSTESLGSIFDAQPSELTGNIYNVTDVSEPVVGYISAGTVQKKRIFVARQQLPAWLPKQFYNCPSPDTVFYKDVKNYFTGHPGEMPLEELDGFGYAKASKKCGDCTLRGVNKKPIFWQ